ncbi:MAG: PRK06851 family protein [Halanaerobiales bacterium]
MSKIKNFFPGGNTPQGFYSFYQYLPYYADRVYIIKGGPGTGKSTFMKKIGYQLNDAGYDIEFHWCSSDNNSLDGVVIPELKTAVLDGTAPHMTDPIYPGAIDEIINLGKYWNRDSLEENRSDIMYLTDLISQRFSQAYSFLKAAKCIHLHWKKYYQKSQDKDFYNKLLDKLICKNVLKREISSGSERHLFGSAITPGGAVNYLENLSEDIENRIVIKGKPGTGKSSLIKGFCAEAAKYGYFILYLHCPMDPEELDAAIIPELNTALLVGTPPHYLEATKAKDYTINLVETINLDYIKDYNAEILDAEKLYEDMMKRVYYFLKSAKNLHDELEEYYVSAMNFEKIDHYRNDLIRKILGN